MRRVVVVSLPVQMSCSTEEQETLERELWEQLNSKPLVVLPAGAQLQVVELPDVRLGPLMVRPDSRFVSSL